MYIYIYTCTYNNPGWTKPYVVYSKRGAILVANEEPVFHPGLTIIYRPVTYIHIIYSNIHMYHMYIYMIFVCISINIQCSIVCIFMYLLSSWDNILLLCSWTPHFWHRKSPLVFPQVSALDMPCRSVKRGLKNTLSCWSSMPILGVSI